MSLISGCHSRSLRKMTFSSNSACCPHGTAWILSPRLALKIALFSVSHSQHLINTAFSHSESTTTAHSWLISKRNTKLPSVTLRTMNTRAVGPSGPAGFGLPVCGPSLVGSLPLCLCGFTLLRHRVRKQSFKRWNRGVAPLYSILYYKRGKTMERSLLRAFTKKC